MPTYTYSCLNKCQKKFEIFKKMSEMLTEEPCPQCGIQSPKQIDQPTFIRKGGGWTRPDPKIPDKYLKMSDAELNEDLGISPDIIC